MQALEWLRADLTLWTRQLDVLRETQPAALWVSARACPDWSPPEVKVLLDEPPSRGPLSGLAAALRSMQTSHLLVLAIDLPEMTSAHLLKLWEMARPRCGVVPTNDGFFEPLCAIYPSEAAPAARTALAGEDFSLQSFARFLERDQRLCPYSLAGMEKRLYRNLNSPGDLPAPIGAGRL